MKRNIDTTIQFSGWKSGHYEYEYKLDGQFFSSFENELLRDGTVEFKVDLERKEHMLMFNFSFSGQVKTTCDRCLGELEIPVEGDQTLCVKFSDTETSDDDEVLILSESAYKIDLAQLMYEYVVVAMPLQCIHPDNDEGHSTCDPEMLKYVSTFSEDDEIESEITLQEEEQNKGKKKKMKEGQREEEASNEGEEAKTVVDPRWAKLLDLK